jgi:gluconolactonase
MTARLTALAFLILPASSFAQDDILAPGATLKIEAEAGSGGEGPAWHPKFGVFSSGGGHIFLLERGGKSRIYKNGAGTNGLLVDKQGRLVCCEPKLRRVTRIELDGSLTVLTDNFDGKKYNQPNDLTIDSKGRIYFTDPRYGSRDDMQIKNAAGEIIEGVYRIDEPGKVVRVVGKKLDRPNGILISADDKTLFVADNNNSASGVVRAVFRFDVSDGDVDRNSKKKVYDWGAGRGPDGLKQDQKGRLFVAGGLNKPNPPHEPAKDVKGGVYVIDPDSGKLLGFIPVPRDEVTNCAFGGDDLKTLYITGGGTLYSIRVATPGRVLYQPK